MYPERHGSFMNVWKVDGFRLQKMAMVWLWARAKEQIEAFADSS